MQPNLKYCGYYYLQKQGYKIQEIADLLDSNYEATKKGLTRTKKSIQQGDMSHQQAMEFGKGYIDRQDIEEPVTEEIEVEEYRSGPEVSLDNGIYRIVSGEREVIISQEKLKKLKELYCLDKLTINQVCRILDITRRDFQLIKLAFGITKDDVPFPDEEFDKNDPDTLAEESIERKKHKYFLRVQQKEQQKAINELEKLRRWDYYVEKIHEIVTSHMEELLQDNNYQVPDTPKPKEREENSEAQPLMFEVPIFDIHLGKLAWKPETGENYDHHIAEQRFLGLIEEQIRRLQVLGIQPEKIVYPVGNDYFTFDTLEGTTSSGTQQDIDLRWQKLFAKGVEMLVKSIDMLSAVAPVEVFVVPGNHDKMTSYYAISYLYAWYHNTGNERVSVDSDPKTRKYVEYGRNLLGFTHGDKEKARLFGNMQVEAPESWGRTRFREWHCGHFHSEHVKEHHGVKVRYLPCMSGIDTFHFEHGYVGAVPQHQSFLWHKERGPYATLITNLDLGSE